MYSKAHRIAKSVAKRESVYDKLAAAKAKAAQNTVGPARSVYASTAEEEADFDHAHAAYLDSLAGL